MSFYVHMYSYKILTYMVAYEPNKPFLLQVVSDPSLTKSGVYWSWNKNSESFENQLSKEASDAEKARKLWEVSEKLVGLA